MIEIDRPVDADELWAKCDRCAFSEIFFSCSPEQQLNLEEVMSAKHSWDTLASLFQSLSLSNIFRLTIEFNALKQRPDQPAMQFMTCVCTAAADLRSLKEDGSDQMIKWHILANLLPSYHALVTTLSNIDTEDRPLTVQSLKEAVFREERQIQQTPSAVAPTAPAPPATSLPAPVYAAAAKPVPVPPYPPVDDVAQLVAWDPTGNEIASINILTRLLTGGILVLAAMIIIETRKLLIIKPHFIFYLSPEKCSTHFNFTLFQLYFIVFSYMFCVIHQSNRSPIRYMQY